MSALYAINQRGEGQGSTGVRVPWWSFTKTVIAAACLRAVEDGLLSLDEPLRASKHTLRQLLRHEAGVPDYGAWPDYQRAVADGLEPWPASEVVRRGLANVADDGQWRYSNIGGASGFVTRPALSRTDGEQTQCPCPGGFLGPIVDPFRPANASTSRPRAWLRLNGGFREPGWRQEATRRRLSTGRFAAARIAS